MFWAYQRLVLAVVSVLSLGTANRGPLPASAQRCSNDAVMKALQSNGAGGVAYCKGLADSGATVTEMATTTAFAAHTTITVTTMMKPTITFVAAKDVVVIVTALTTCNDSGDISSDTDSDTDNATTPATSTFPGRIGGRDLKVPANLAGYSSEQIASACGCLVVGAKKTVTGMTTVTSSTSVTTELYTVMTGDVVQETSWILATYTNTVTSCVDGPTTSTGAVGRGR